MYVQIFITKKNIKKMQSNNLFYQLMFVYSNLKLKFILKEKN